MPSPATSLSSKKWVEPGFFSQISQAFSSTSSLLPVCAVYLPTWRWMSPHRQLRFNEIMCTCIVSESLGYSSHRKPMCRQLVLIYKEASGLHTFHIRSPLQVALLNLKNGLAGEATEWAVDLCLGRRSQATSLVAKGKRDHGRSQLWHCSPTGQQWGGFRTPSLAGSSPCLLKTTQGEELGFISVHYIPRSKLKPYG